jgi:HNH endonuclease
MSISKEIRELVRQRAGCACEFCGVSETDTGGELTLDHYHPHTKGGTDGLENLLYCCTRCNLYKHDYFPNTSFDPALWNPRAEPASRHFLELEDGSLSPLTPTGAFTLQRLRLNRPPLVAHRLFKRKSIEEAQLLNRYRELLALLEQVNTQLGAVTEEQHSLLEEQQRLLRLLMGR